MCLPHSKEAEQPVIGVLSFNASTKLLVNNMSTALQPKSFSEMMILDFFFTAKYVVSYGKIQKLNFTKYFNAFSVSLSTRVYQQSFLIGKDLDNLRVFVFNGIIYLV